MTTRSKYNGCIPNKWEDPIIYDIPNEFLDAIGGMPLIAQVMYRRGIKSSDEARGYLHGEQYQPASPLELQNLDAAVQVLETSIVEKRKIGVWGDFDVDGQTATTLLVSILRQIGADISYHIPVRGNESHGISIPYLQTFLDEGIEALITCDTGITSHESIAYAQQRGIKTIITDHHDLPACLPDADAIVNPKQLSTDHPLYHLPGVGVAYQVMYELCKRNNLLSLVQNTLDLVALGIVADLASLVGDTRWLLQQGLKVLRQTSRVGVNVLTELLEINPENITEEHISFYLAPRLNAIGRLADANQIVEFLTTTDISKAKLIAVEIEGINAQRKLVTDQVYKAALTQIDANPDQLASGVIVLSNPSWPAGVVGIVASRLTERYNLPTILFSAPPGQIARGSARSIDGLNITQAIAQHAHLLVNYGGHPMAAGLGIRSENIPQFQKAFIQTIQHLVDRKKAVRSLHIDGFIPLGDISLELATEIERLSPFGPGNPSPVLATRNLQITGYTSVGRNSEHLLLSVEDESGLAQKVIWWQGADWQVPQGKIDLAYTVRASTFRGQRDVQIEWLDYRPTEEKLLQIIEKKPLVRFIDYRQEVQPITLLKPLLLKEGIQVWCEATPLSQGTKCDRFNLTSPCQKLVIWTVPPGPNEFRMAINKTSPETIYLFANNPNLDTPESFLTHLSGLLKYAIDKKNRIVSVSSLASASAHRERTIHAGILWLQAHGHFSFSEIDADSLLIREGTQVKQATAREISRQLQIYLRETAAFRSFYQNADQEVLINLLFPSKANTL